MGWSRGFGGIWRRHGRQAAAAVVISGALVLAGGAHAVDGRDQTVVAELRLGNDQQIRLADLGKERGGTEAVRGLAEVMAEDHRAADLDLLAYAGLRQMDLSVVGRPGADRPLHGPLAFEELRTAPVARFDYEFVSRVVTDQQATVDELESAHKIARDPQLVALIDAALPTVRAHLARARAVLAGIREPAAPPLTTVPAPSPPSP